MRQITARGTIVEHSSWFGAAVAAPRVAISIGLIAGTLIAGSAVAAAAEIVALGASNTAGLGVSRGQAYPAQLQAMLRAKGLNVSVGNAGISGDTSAGILRRLGSAVPAGTRVVVLDPGNNDVKACTEPSRPQRCATPAERAANIDAISSRLRARGVAVVMANIEFQSVPISHWQADRRHLTSAGHRVIAARLVPQVAAALGSGR
jgi:acyl-CoA thioesterase-1